MERPFGEVEVLETLRSLKEEEAPGPNRFPIKFFKEYLIVVTGK